MGIEQALAANTAAIEKLCGLLQAAAPAQLSAITPAPATPAEQPPAEQPTAEQPTAEQPTVEHLAVEQPAVEQPAAPVPYTAVMAAVTKAMTYIRKDGVLELLGQFGVKTAKDLQPEQYAEAVRVFTEAAK